MVLIEVVPAIVVAPSEVLPVETVSPPAIDAPPVVTLSVPIEAVLLTVSPVPAAENVDAPVKVLDDVPD